MAVAAAGILMTSLTFPFALCNGLGRPIFGTLTDKLTPRNAAMITYVLIIVACLMLYTNYASVTMYTIAFALLWGCLGGWLAIAPTATASFFGMKDYAKNYGLVFTAYGIGAAIGGIVSAQAKDTHGRLSALLPYCGRSCGAGHRRLLHADEAACQGGLINFFLFNFFMMRFVQ